jgi:hypothetical protein
MDRGTVIEERNISPKPYKYREGNTQEDGLFFPQPKTTKEITYKETTLRSTQEHQ